MGGCVVGMPSSVEGKGRVRGFLDDALEGRGGGHSLGDVVLEVGDDVGVEPPVRLAAAQA